MSNKARNAHAAIYMGGRHGRRATEMRPAAIVSSGQPNWPGYVSVTATPKKKKAKVWSN
jgi:hypothetical protein